MLDLNIALFMSLVILAFVLIVIDCSLGMFFGTLGAPILMSFGFEPYLVVPSILISQLIGDVSGTYAHHKWKNAVFNGLTKDVKIVLTMVIPGIPAVFLAAMVSGHIPTWSVKTCVGFIAIVFGILCTTRIKFKFKWWRHIFYGICASFFKCLGGGGFGPLTSTGGIIGGLEAKISVATTTFAELIICALSFILLSLIHGLPNPYFAGSMCIGAFAGGFLGPYIASKVNQEKLRTLVAILGIIAGIWCIIKVFV